MTEPTADGTGLVPADGLIQLVPTNEKLFFVDGKHRSSDFIEASSGGFFEVVSGKSAIFFS